MRIGLIADTHGFLDETPFSPFLAVYEVWHAGDFGSVKVLKRLRQFKLVRGVYGNIDGPEVAASLRRTCIGRGEGLSVYMTHVGGHPGRYDPRRKNRP